MDAGPIHWSSINQFGFRYNIVGDEFDRMASIIRAMDEAHRDYHKAKP